MSMHTYKTTGYGFSCDNISESNFKVFIENHADTIREKGSHKEKELLQEITTNNDCCLEDLEDDFQIEDNNFYTESLYSVISNIIDYETDIHVGFFKGDDETECEAAIMLPNGMPWEFSKREKQLEEKTLHDIFMKYTEELYLKEPSDISVEYFS